MIVIILSSKLKLLK